jgi:multimeric flavodoxin WrbA
MEVLAFSTSPRRAGNTEFLLGRVIEGLETGGAHVRRIRTHDLNISPCTGCGGCERNGVCVIDDDFRAVSVEIVLCDGILFAAPLYFMNVPARGKALIDRLQAFWVARHRLGLDLFGGRRRFGLLISCSGQVHGPGGADVFRGIEDTMTYAFDALGAEKVASLLVRKVDSPGAVTGMPEVLKRARRIGTELARFG